MADLASAWAPVRVALDGVARYTGTPIWSADGEHLWVTGWPGLFKLGLAGGQAEKVSDANAWVEDRSPDGRTLAIMRDDTASTLSDIWLVPTTGGPAVPFRQTPFAERELRIAPDGRWAVWVSNETGTNEVYIARFPTPGEITRVSPNGGQWPMWRRDGRELYYRGPGNALMAVDVSVSNDAIRLSPPRELFTIPTVFLTTTRRQYAPSSDGQRFLVNAHFEDSLPRTLKLILNWPALGTR